MQPKTKKGEGIVKKLFLCLAFVLLAGCAPKVVALGPDSLTLRYDPTLTSLATVEARAETLCRENYGKKARFIMSEPPIKICMQYATFACE